MDAGTAHAVARYFRCSTRHGGCFTRASLLGSSRPNGARYHDRMLARPRVVCAAAALIASTAFVVGSGCSSFSEATSEAEAGSGADGSLDEGGDAPTAVDGDGGVDRSVPDSG